MNPTALGLVLVAAVIHATWNLSAKRVPDGGARFVFIYYSISALLFAPIGAIELFVMHRPLSWHFAVGVVVSGALHASYAVILQRGYAVGDLSVVYPLARGTGPLLSVLAAVILLGERPGWLGALGAVLIVGGVFVIGTARPPDQSHSDRKAHRAGIGYGILTGATIAGYTVWDAHSVNALNLTPLAYFGGSALMTAAFLTPYAMRDRPAIRKIWQHHKKHTLIIGFLSPIAYILVLYAMRLAPISLVAPAREISIVFGGFIAWFSLKEANPVRRLVGSVVVLAGIVAIALA